MLPIDFRARGPANYILLSLMPRRSMTLEGPSIFFSVLLYWQGAQGNGLPVRAQQCFRSPRQGHKQVHFHMLKYLKVIPIENKTKLKHLNIFCFHFLPYNSTTIKTKLKSSNRCLMSDPCDTNPGKHFVNLVHRFLTCSAIYQVSSLF